MSFLIPALLIISSFLSFAVIYYKIPGNALNIVLVVLMVGLILITSRLNDSANSLFKKINQSLITILSSLFVQIFVISSGGFYSPFLILIHLYSLAVSFLITLPSSITFLITSSALLIFNLYYNQVLLLKFKEDPFTLVLYVVSFIVIIPLAHIVNKTYHLKSSISEKLKNVLEIQTSKEASILRSLEEIVFITDPNLTILSANNAFEKILSLSGLDYLNKPALEVLNLYDSNGNKMTRESLYLDTVLRDRSTRIIAGISMYTKLKPQPININIQMRPIPDSKGKINQLIFILSEKSLAKTGTLPHQDLQDLRNSNNKLLMEIRQSLVKASIPGMDLQLELFANTQEDLNIAQELEDHPIKEFKVLTDIALMSKKIILNKNDFAKKLGVLIEFSLPENEVAEQTAINMVEQNSPFAGDVIPDFALPIDAKWVEIMISKLIELSIFLSSDQENPKVSVSIYKQSPMLDIKITTPCPILGIDYNVLFKPYYNHLGLNSNLKLASGLEGYIAKYISSQLGHPITVDHISNPNKAIIKLTFTK